MARYTRPIGQLSMADMLSRSTASTRSYTGQATIDKAMREQHAFLKQADLEAIAADPNTRLTPVLIRCGSGRFTCPAQDASHFIGIIERDYRQTRALGTGDYVRDVSLPAASKGGR